MRLDVYFHSSPNNDLTTLLHQILEELQIMATNFDALTTQLNANADLIDSVIVLVKDLRQKIIDAGVDPAKLLELTNALAAKDQQLADAVAAGTPADPNA